VKIATRPFVTDSMTPAVHLVVGGTTAEMNPAQAEDLATSLMRAATASRYEAATAHKMATTRNMSLPYIQKHLDTLRTLVAKMGLKRQ
jgi:hypothetical protein